MKIYRIKKNKRLKNWSSQLHGDLDGFNATPFAKSGLFKCITKYMFFYVYNSNEISRLTKGNKKKIQE